MRHCGHEPDTQEHREADCDPDTGCLYRATGPALEVDTVLRPIGRIHWQPMLPDCTGEALAACLEAQTGRDVSGRDIWAEGLRRCDKTPGFDTGLAFVPALIGIERRGWADYREGEEVALPPPRAQLDDELDAADRVGRVATRYRVPTGPGMVAAIADGLLHGLDCVFGSLVSDDYQGHRVPHGQVSVVAPEMLGLRGDPHAQRLVGFIRHGSTWVAVIQNSWGTGWGGAMINGIYRAGCALASLECLELAYDVHLIGVRP